MRRKRMRSMTIDAENEEDFIRQYDKAKNNSSKQILYKKENKENIDEDEYDELTDNKKPKESFNVKEIDEDEYSDLGAINNDDEEELLGNEYENDEVFIGTIPVLAGFNRMQREQERRNISRVNK